MARRTSASVRTGSADPSASSSLRPCRPAAVMWKVEFGSLSGGTPEPYRVSVSNDPDGPFTIIADGTGEQSFDLADVGLRSARYVKVESLASEVDVLNGLGSPLAPGPELDAIGAVHPGAP